MFRIQTKIAMTAIAAAFLIAAPQHSAAQTDAKLPSFRTKEDFTAHIRRAQETEEVLIAEENRLTAQITALESVTGPYIIESGDSYRSLGVDEAEALASLAGLMAISYEIGALPPDVGAGSEISAALQAALDFVKTQSDLGRTPEANPAEDAQEAFRGSLESITARNREAIAKDLDRLRAQRAQSRQNRERLADFVQVMLTWREISSSETDASAAGGRIAAPVGVICASSGWGDVKFSSGGDHWEGTYSDGYDLRDRSAPDELETGSLRFSFDWSNRTGRGIWRQSSINREGTFSEVKISENGAEIVIDFKYNVTARGDQDLAIARLSDVGSAGKGKFTCAR